MTRRLSDDEQALWTTVTRAIKPLKAKPVPPERPPDSAVGSSPARKAKRAAAPARFAAAAVPVDGAPPPLAPFERRLRQRIAKGHEPIARRIDLHGLTQREAHAALAGFLRTAQSQGARIVLVVTGKGARPGERDPFAERGVLRRLVPQWLQASELRDLVVGFEAAHGGHGGEGALYVRLRRARALRG